MVTGAAAIVELVYHTQLKDTLGQTVEFMGATLDARSVDTWFGAVFVLLTGLALFELARRRYMRDWGETQEWIEREIKRREAL
jgi:branched-chain amino acid transport system permease protein